MMDFAVSRLARRYLFDVIDADLAREDGLPRAVRGRSARRRSPFSSSARRAARAPGVPELGRRRARVPASAAARCRPDEPPRRSRRDPQVRALAGPREGPLRHARSPASRSSSPAPRGSTSTGAAATPSRPLSLRTACTRSRCGSRRSRRRDLGALLRFGGFPEPFFRSSDRALAPLAAGASRSRRPRRPARPRARSRDLARRAARRRAAVTRRLPALGQEPARGSRGRPRDGRALAQRSSRTCTSASASRRSGRPGSAPSRRSASSTSGTGRPWRSRERASRTWWRRHLLKLCHFREDTEGHRMELRFLRDTDAREVDFVVLENRKPLFAVEVKTGERAREPRHSLLQAADGHPALVPGPPRSARTSSWTACASCRSPRGAERSGCPDRRTQAGEPRERCSSASTGVSRRAVSSCETHALSRSYSESSTCAARHSSRYLSRT